MSSFNKYILVFKNSWQNQLEYRIETLVRFLIVFISLISVFYLWNDVYAQKAVLVGYTKQQMVTYYILVGYLFSSLYASIPISNEIQDGSLSMYLTKPISYVWYHYWMTVARRLLRLLIGLPVLIAIFFFFRHDLYLVTDIKSYLILFATCFGAINILFFLDVIFNYIEFWMFNSSSLSLIFDTIIAFFAGTLIPIFLLPTSIQTIGNYLPFKYTGFFLIDSFLGRNTPSEILFGIGIQFCWTFFFYVLAKILWTRGIKKYEAVGN